MALCLSVRHKSKGMDGLILFFAWRLSLIYPTLCFKEIQLPTKIRVLPSGTLSRTRDFEIFSTVSRLSNGVINVIRKRWTVVGQLS